MFAPLASAVGRSLLTYPPALSFAASTLGLAAAPFTYAAGRLMAKRKYPFGKGKAPTGYGVRIAKRRRTRGRAFRGGSIPSSMPAGFGTRPMWYRTRRPFRFRFRRRRALRVKENRGTGTYDTGTCSISLIQRRYPRIGRTSLLGKFILSDAWTTKQTDFSACSHGWTRIHEIASVPKMSSLEQTIPVAAGSSSQRRWFLKHSQTYFEVSNVADIPIKLTLFIFMNKQDTDEHKNVGGVATLNEVRDPYKWLKFSTKEQTVGGAVANGESKFGWDLSMASPLFKQYYKTVRICHMYIPACQTRSVNMFIKHNKICNSRWNLDGRGSRYTSVHILGRARTVQGRSGTGNAITFENARMNFMGYTKYHYQAMEYRSSVHVLNTIAAGPLAAFPDPQDESVTVAPVAMAQ